MSLVYLACPYSDPDPAVREERFQAANAEAARMMAAGMHVFSPISHTHPIALAGNLPLGWDFWESYDRTILQCCSRVVVLKLDGWSQSNGVLAEIELAVELGLPIEYREPLIRLSRLKSPAHFSER
jgi:hypothetical protein